MTSPAEMPAETPAETPAKRTAGRSDMGNPFRKPLYPQHLAERNLDRCLCMSEVGVPCANPRAAGKGFCQKCVDRWGDDLLLGPRRCAGLVLDRSGQKLKTCGNSKQAKMTHCCRCVRRMVQNAPPPAVDPADLPEKRVCILCQQDSWDYNIFYCSGEGACSNVICRRKPCLEGMHSIPGRRCMICRQDDAQLNPPKRARLQ